MSLFLYAISIEVHLTLLSGIDGITAITSADIAKKVILAGKSVIRIHNPDFRLGTLYHQIGYKNNG